MLSNSHLPVFKLRSSSAALKSEEGSGADNHWLILLTLRILSSKKYLSALYSKLGQVGYQNFGSVLDLGIALSCIHFVHLSLGPRLLSEHVAQQELFLLLLLL